MRSKIIFTISGHSHQFVLESARKNLSPAAKKSLRLQIASQLPANLTPLHACLLERSGLGLLISGESKSGKSSLAHALTKHGFKTLANDFVVTWVEDGKLTAGDLNFLSENANKASITVDYVFLLLPTDPRDVFILNKSLAVDFYVNTLLSLSKELTRKIAGRKVFDLIYQKHICLGNRISVSRWEKSLLAQLTKKSNSRTGIIGMGVIGQDVANLLLTQNWLESLHLFTPNQKKLECLILDLKSANPFLPIVGYSNFESVFKNCDVVVICLRVDTVEKSSIDERMAKFLPHAQVMWKISRAIRKKNFRVKCW